MPKGRSKTFADALNERLDKTEIQRLQSAAILEEEFFASLKQEVNEAIHHYMLKNNVGSSQLANILCCSDSQTLRIISGRYGFTMATVAHVGAAIKLKPHIVFEKIQ